MSDNYELIAQNITVIYLILKEKYSDSFKDERELLTTVAKINLVAYLNENSISLKEIDNAYLLGKRGTCSLDLLDYLHIDDGQRFFLEFEDRLLGFIMQIQCLIFRVDIQMITSKDIVFSVISKKNIIKETMLRTIKNFKQMSDSLIVKGYSQSVDYFMQNRTH